jgi:hypothetical protein
MIGIDLSSYFGAQYCYFCNIGFNKEDALMVLADFEKEYVIVLGVDVYSFYQNTISVEGVWALRTLEGEGMYDKCKRSIKEAQSFVRTFNKKGLLFCLTIKE